MIFLLLRQTIITKGGSGKSGSLQRVNITVEHAVLMQFYNLAERKGFKIS
jgi:hypothetical protein